MLNNKFDRKVLASVVPVLVFLAFVLFVMTFGHASTGKSRENSLGVVILDDNQNIYMFGRVAHGTVFECGKNEICTNVMMRPYNTDMLHTEQVLLCGNEVESFKGKTDHNVILTYYRVAHRAYGGVACHDLRSVFTVPDSPDTPLF